MSIFFHARVIIGDFTAEDNQLVKCIMTNFDSPSEFVDTFREPEETRGFIEYVLEKFTDEMDEENQDNLAKDIGKYGIAIMLTVCEGEPDDGTPDNERGAVLTMIGFGDTAKTVGKSVKKSLDQHNVRPHGTTLH